MCDCTFLIKSIHKGGKDLEETLHKLINGEDPCALKNVVYHVYKNYCGKCNHLFTWEDLYYETLTRLILSIQKGNDPRKKDCRPFLFQIAKFVCMELGRTEAKHQDKKEESWMAKSAQKTKRSSSNPNFPVEDLAVLRGMVPELDKATTSCLEEIGEKCKLILNLRFFNTEIIDQPEDLAEALKAKHYEVSPRVIPQEISNCKAKLRKLLKKKLEKYYQHHF